MSTFRSFPRHLKPLTGKGMVTCARTGFLRRPEDIVIIDGVPMAKDHADFYGAFGYTHPQDVPQPDIGGDPSPIDYGGSLKATTKGDLKISDQEIEAAIRENRAPRSMSAIKAQETERLITYTGLPVVTSDGLAFFVLSEEEVQFSTLQHEPLLTVDFLKFATPARKSG